MTDDDLAQLVIRDGYAPRRVDHLSNYICPLHHHSQSELMICLSGSLLVFTPGYVYPLTPGSKIIIPSGTAHSVAVSPCGCSCLYSD